MNRKTLPVILLAWAWLCQSARSQEPPPAPRQLPVRIIHITKLTVPGSRKVGQMIDIGVDGSPATGAVPPDLAWTVDGKPPTPETLRVGENKFAAVAVALEGEHSVALKAEPYAAATESEVLVWIVDATGDTGVKAPDPPVPLVTLVDKPTADAWAGVLRVLATPDVVSTFTDAAKFWTAHDWYVAERKKITLPEKAKARFAELLAPALAEPIVPATLSAKLTEVAKSLSDEVKPPPDSPATAATYIHEKDATPVPSPVLVGLDRLNREKKILATVFEDDTTDGDGDVPDQYRIPLDAARKEGLPALVVTAGSDVLKVVKDPRTVEQVFEAIAP